MPKKRRKRGKRLNRKVFIKGLRKELNAIGEFNPTNIPPESFQELALPTRSNHTSTTRYKKQALISRKRHLTRPREMFVPPRVYTYTSTTALYLCTQA